MNRVWIAALGVAALAVSAFSIYLDQRSSSPDRNHTPSPRASGERVGVRGNNSVSAATQGEVFSLLGKRATLPDVSFVDSGGRPIRLSDFRGKTILLNIWATWCAPCRKEMPALDRLQAKLGGPGFEVVALSIDRGGTPAVKPFYEELDIKELRIYVDPTAQATSALSAIGLPTTLLVDPQGREIGRKVGPAEWDSPQVVKVIQKYLETPVASAPGRGLFQ